MRVVGSLALLSACSPEPTVQRAGDEGYTVKARSPESSAGILLTQNAALQNARAFCAAQGRRFLALQSGVGEEGFPRDLTYTVHFRCVDAGSPLLQRPTVDQAPDDLL